MIRFFPSHFFPFFSLGFILFINACSALPVTDKNTEQARKLLSRAKKASTPSRAIQFLQQALDYDSMLSEIYLELSGRYEETGDNLNALNLLNKAAQRGIGNPEIYFRLACLYYEWKDYAQAAKYFEYVPQTDSLYYHSLFMRAQIYYLTENYDSSAQMIERLKNQVSLFFRPETQRMLERLVWMGFVKADKSPAPDNADSRLLTRYDLAQLACTYFRFDPSSDTFFNDISPNDPRFPAASAAVTHAFLDRLPDRKFYPDFPISRRNLAFILYQWASKTQPALLALPTSYPSWKDLSTNDPHYHILITAYYREWVVPESSSVFNADAPLNRNEALAGFKKFLQDSENPNK